MNGAGDVAGGDGASSKTLGLSEELLAETYDVLRKMASRQLRGQRQGATLNTTLIVHEAWLKLSHDSNQRFVDQNHYLATASRAMRQVLVDHARRKLAEKRGGGAIHVSIEDHQIAEGLPEREILEVDAALEVLAERSPYLAQLVECRFFAGLTVEETASVLGRSLRTLERDWTRARTYLADLLRADR